MAATERTRQAQRTEGGKSGFENVYLDGRREYMERYGDIIGQERRWRFVAAAAVGVAAILACGIVYIATQSRVVPYVVEVNRLGDAVGVRRADLAAPPNAAVLASSLANWITDARTVYLDADALHRDINQLYAMTAKGSPAEQALNERYQTSSPFDRAKNEVVTVAVQQPLPVTDHTWRVEWRETIQPRNGGAARVESWAATITFEIVPPDTEQKIQLNPAGLFVQQFSWSQRY